MPKGRRPELLQIKVTESEKERIKRAGYLKGLSMAAFTRVVTLEAADRHIQGAN